MIRKIVKWALVILAILFVLAVLNSSSEEKTPTSERGAANTSERTDSASRTASSPAATSENLSSSAETPTAASAPTGAVTPGCFVAYKGNPILKNGSLFSGAAWNDPSVIKVGSEYIMYASAAAGFNSQVKLYRLTSTNGTDWSLSPKTPVLSPGGGSAFDSKGTENPSIVYFKGTYYLFYLGYDTTYSDIYAYRIGYATSADGINFTKAGSPIIVPTGPQKGDPTGNFMQYVVAEPGAVVYNDKIYLYFTAVGADMQIGNSLQTVALVTSSDGRNWSSPTQVLKPDQSLYPRSAGWVGYSTPAAVVINNKMHLFFDAVNEVPTWKQVALGHAVSNNGVSGWTQDTKSIFTRSNFSWTSEEILGPAAVLDGNTLKLWFAGNNAEPNLGIGMATCQL